MNKIFFFIKIKELKSEKILCFFFAFSISKHFKNYFCPFTKKFFFYFFELIETKNLDFYFFGSVFQNRALNKKNFSAKSKYLIEENIKANKNNLEFFFHIKKYDDYFYKNFIFLHLFPSVIIKIENKKLFEFFIFPIFHEKDNLWNDAFSFFFEFYKTCFFQNLKIKVFCIYIILTEILWLLDCQYEKIWKRKIHEGNICLPPSFITSLFSDKFYGKIWNFYLRNRSNHIKKEKKKKILRESDLRKFFKLIKIFLKGNNNFFIEIKNEINLFDIFTSLSDTLVSYAEYNKISLKRIKENHARKNFRNLEKFLMIKTYESTKKNNFKSKNSEIIQNITEKIHFFSYYTPFDLGFFLPREKQLRVRSLISIELPFPIEILHYIPGSNYRKVLICWKIPSNINQRSIIKKNLIINSEISKFPFFYSRAMLNKKIKKKNI
jgi:hypothetical protein